MPGTVTYRGELRCFSCGRYLGEFESHPEQHGARDLHLLPVEPGVEIRQPIQTERGLRCPACQGRVIAGEMDRIAA